MKEIYMGYAQEDITPIKSVQLVGYDGRPDNMSRGVLHRLITQVLVWRTTKEKCCLIAIDSLGFTVELTDLLRFKVAKVLNTDSEKVMVCFSHTHAAPNAGINKEYYDFACNQIIQAVKCAGKFMIPIRAVWGVATNEIGVNRRGSEHSFDNRLGILKIAGTNSNDLKVLILRVTAHANVLTKDNYLISPDYFGTTRELLENKYNCKVVVIQGAAGDVRPKYRQENADFLEIHPVEAAQQIISETMKKEYFKQSLQSLNKMASLIYQSVDSVIDKLIPQSIHTLSMFSIRSSFYADVPSSNRALELADEAKQNAGIDGTNWLNEVKRLQHENIKSQSSTIEIQYFVVDNGCICGIPNEVMSDIAIDIQKKTNNTLLLFNGYTNGCGSYLPTAEEYDKGGYEVFWSSLLYYTYHGRVMPLNRDTAERLESDVVKYWKEFCGKKKIFNR